MKKINSLNHTQIWTHLNLFSSQSLSKTLNPFHLLLYCWLRFPLHGLRFRNPLHGTPDFLSIKFFNLTLALSSRRFSMDFWGFAADGCGRCGPRICLPWESRFGFQFCLFLFCRLGFSSGGGRCGEWWRRWNGFSVIDRDSEENRFKWVKICVWSSVLIFSLKVWRGKH